ncbi:hypothetical protein GBJ32_05835 [Bifidobacterium longum]|uniref:Uncharacterized protein n=1 Tax=Bifidobacterium longum TaxID=216816 RepID=A0A6G0GY16_BIFLN|nr:hypothetical protein GBJ29_05845 [Bifidobacterium longum]KAB7020685.1 hypothetical protein GBI72_06500 [Bifidobacterium longum]KAB7025879.1 hypothetical protein GBJ23_07625 [Bifidobacterium longum]KAB7026831.1 hypothetical protein GBI75_06110 [Bifidobacterium longum]KAB7032904.1 hypothetical protein GBJ28_04965 [Bifidobacterium longum]
MTVGTTEKYRFPYPEDNEPIRNLPDILQQQAEGIERVLAKFDYGGGDQNALTARVASLETLLSNIKSNYVTLYDNDNNVFQGAISLNESAANFEKLTICFKSNDNVYASMDVANPNKKIVSLTTSFYNGNASFYVKNRCYLIDGKTINTWKRSTSTVYQTGEVNAAGSNNAYTGDFITITQVYGTRKMSLV